MRFSSLGFTVLLASPGLVAAQVGYVPVPPIPPVSIAPLAPVAVPAFPDIPAIGMARLAPVAEMAPLASLAALSALAPLAPFSSFGPVSMTASMRTHPPLISAAQNGPADSLYRVAREALNRNEYGRAADLFSTLRRRYPRSDYAGDAHYWEAYARYRMGGTDQLRTSLALLEEQGRTYPDASTKSGGDADALQTRVLGELARQGDANAARRIAVVASGAPVAAGAPMVAPVAPVAVVGVSRSSRCEGEDDLQASALNAVLQMDSERAIPILEKVLARRDEGSACLRRRAVFIISQHKGERVEQMLLDAVRNDPDPEVKSQAVFWLSQVNSPRAVAAIESVLATSQDPKLQERAVFALSQQNRPEARAALRNYAARNDVSEDIRDKAVFWLGQSNDPQDAAFLQDLYGKVQGDKVKERIIFSVSQNNRASSEWFGRIARNQSEPLELRKKALFWMGQRNGTTGIGSRRDLRFVLRSEHEGAAHLRPVAEERPRRGG